MKLIVIVIALCLGGCNGGDNSIDKRLAEVREADQSIRNQMMELTKAVTIEGRTELIDSLLHTSEQMELIDARNISIVDSLLHQGLPKGLATDSYGTIWLVIDHAPLGKQEAYLPLIEQMSARNLIGKDDYATLFDRIAMGQNRPQRYGTQSVQFGVNEAQQLHLWPVENPEILDSLRASVGMSPIAEYLNVLTNVTGIKAQFDTTLSIEEINHLRNM